MSERGEALPSCQPNQNNSKNPKKILLTNFTKNWLVLYVRSRWEKKVHDALERIDIESFLPLTQTSKQWSDRKKIIYEPLFPSYVFVKIKSSLDFHKALSTNGACSYISFGREYAKVHSSEIDKIKMLVNAENILDLEVDNNPIKVGLVKTIKQGSLRGLECEILKINNKNKVVVRIDSLQQNILATIPVDYI